MVRLATIIDMILPYFGLHLIYAENSSGDHINDRGIPQFCKAYPCKERYICDTGLDMCVSCERYCHIKVSDECDTKCKEHTGPKRLELVQTSNSSSTNSDLKTSKTSSGKKTVTASVIVLAFSIALLLVYIFVCVKFRYSLQKCSKRLWGFCNRAIGKRKPSILLNKNDGASDVNVLGFRNRQKDEYEMEQEFKRAYNHKEAKQTQVIDTNIETHNSNTQCESEGPSISTEGTSSDREITCAPEKIYETPHQILQSTNTAFRAERQTEPTFHRSASRKSRHSVISIASWTRSQHTTLSVHNSTIPRDYNSNVNNSIICSYAIPTLSNPERYETHVKQPDYILYEGGQTISSPYGGGQLVSEECNEKDDTPCVTPLSEEDSHDDRLHMVQNESAQHLFYQTGIATEREVDISRNKYIESIHSDDCYNGTLTSDDVYENRFEQDISKIESEHSSYTDDLITVTKFRNNDGRNTVDMVRAAGTRISSSSDEFPNETDNRFSNDEKERLYMENRISTGTMENMENHQSSNIDVYSSVTDPLVEQPSVESDIEDSYSSSDHSFTINLSLNDNIPPRESGFILCQPSDAINHPNYDGNNIGLYELEGAVGGVNPSNDQPSRNYEYNSIDYNGLEGAVGGLDPPNDQPVLDHGLDSNVSYILRSITDDSARASMIDPAYMNRDGFHMQHFDNNPIYDQLQRIHWVMGYHSEGRSISVYADLDTYDTNDLERQLVEATGQPPQKFKLKRNVQI